MSKFFDVTDSSDSSDNEADRLPVKPPPAARNFQISDDEEDVKRVVRSEKEKRYEELHKVIGSMKNHKKIKDMANVLTDFENLGKAYERAKKVIEKEGGAVPRFFTQCLIQLEDFVNEMWQDKAGRQAMSKNNSKGLASLRQKLRKYVRNFEEVMAAYRADPDQDEDEAGAAGDEDAKDSDADSSDDDSDGDIGFKVPGGQLEGVKVRPPVASGSDIDFEDESEEESTEYTDSSDDDDMFFANPADRFLKKEVDPEQLKKKKEDERAKRAARVKDKKEDAREEEEWTTVEAGGVAIPKKKLKMFAKETEITHDAILKKLVEIVAVRGKKATDRVGQIGLLMELRDIAKMNNLGAALDVKLMFHIMAAVFDYNPTVSSCMKNENWDSCLDTAEQLLELLQANNDVYVGENLSEDSETLSGEGPLKVRACVFTVVERLHEEYTKMLQGCDAHSTEYIDRLKDLPRMVGVVNKLEEYTKQRAEQTKAGAHANQAMITEETCRVYLLKVLYLYYKFDPQAYDQDESGDDVGSLKEMARLCKYVYAHDSTDRIRTQAILCHIYHLALHDRWYEARDIMLMSHLQDSIAHSDVKTQILYNRTMVQLGLCAFRQGMIRDAHHCLVDIQSSGRAKELLAQGLLLQRQHERSPEQEKIEKRRQMPYHMHINLELLECVYLVSAMLLEIPYMAAHALDTRRRMISKNFHHVLRISERQLLTGPPESMREHVVQAAKAMKRGEWKACLGHLINEKMNAKVWDLFHKSDQVRTMIQQKVQEESLRTYLFTYSSVYDSLSLVSLRDMFELTKGVIHSVISKMIINEELMASMDEPSQTVVMHRTEPTRLQYLALQLSEKLGPLMDNNDRLMETKKGIAYFQRQGQQQGFSDRPPRDDDRREGGWSGRRDNRDRDGGWGGGRRDNRDRDGGGWGGGRRDNRDRDGGWGGGRRDNRDRGQVRWGGHGGMTDRRPRY